MTVLGTALYALGTVVAVIAVVGFFRMRSDMLRLKPFALLTVTGAAMVHAGAALMLPGGVGYKGLITAAVFLLVGPAISQALAYGALTTRKRSRSEDVSAENNPE